MHIQKTEKTVFVMIAWVSEPPLGYDIISTVTRTFQLSTFHWNFSRSSSSKTTIFPFLLISEINDSHFSHSHHDRKVYYRRGTARRAVCRNLVDCCTVVRTSSTTLSQQIDVIKLEHYGRQNCSKQSWCIDRRRCSQQSRQSTSFDRLVGGKFF